MRFSLAILVTCSAYSLAEQKEAGDAPGKKASLEDDLKSLQGAWNPAKSEAKLREFTFQIEVHKNKLLISYGRDGGGNMVQIDNFESPFELKQAGEKRRIVPMKKDASISQITYRIEKGRLIVADGLCGIRELKGVWERAVGLVP